MLNVLLDSVGNALFLQADEISSLSEICGLLMNLFFCSRHQCAAHSEQTRLNYGDFVVLSCHLATDAMLVGVRNFKNSIEPKKNVFFL
jgi:hypothetical protein